MQAGNDTGGALLRKGKEGAGGHFVQNFSLGFWSIGY